MAGNSAYRKGVCGYQRSGQMECLRQQKSLPNKDLFVVRDSTISISYIRLYQAYNFAVRRQ
jgi:hypothetical protein